MIKLSLLNSYIRTALRNIVKNKVFSAINIFGLAISMSIGLLIITMVNELTSYDDFHLQSDRIYRVNNTFQYLSEDPSLFASTSVLTGKRVEDVAGIEASVLIFRNFDDDFGSEERKVPLEGYFASGDFFRIFTFKSIEGAVNTALVDPYSIVLTAKAADKLFGRQQGVVGEVLLTPDEKQYTVTALVENPPFNSHLQFEILGSFSTKEDLSKDDERFLSWTNMWMYHVYVLLKEGISTVTIQESLDLIAAEENAKIEHRSIELGLQHLQSITPGVSMSNEIGKTTSREIPILLSVFALIVIASACFNYTNLSIAKSLKRAKEVGVRKVVGSNRGQVFYQFLVESMVVAILALVLAIGLFFLIKTPFLSLHESLTEQIKLNLTGTMVIQFIVFALLTGIFAGILPAYIYARVAPSSVFRNSLSMGEGRSITLRKVLIVVQFTLSVIFIFSAIIEYRQFKYATSFDLGYSTDNILNVNLQKNDVDAVKAAFDAIPEVEMLSASLMVTSVGSYWAERVKYKDPMDSASVYFNGIDINYIPLHDHKLIAGKNFAPLSGDSSTLQVIVNEQLLKRFDIGTPDEALGEVLLFDKQEATIVGVIGDFHYGTISRKVDPFLFKYQKEDFYKVNIKFNDNADIVVGREKIEKAWKNVDDIHPIEARFYNDNIERQYEDYSIMVKVIGSLAILAIIIATMGLLGMVMFTAETRIKEIGIRKVLGATESSLIYLLGKGFFILLIIASLIAVPFTIFLFNNVVLSDVAYKARIGIFDSLAGPLFILTLGIITIGIITLFAARTNPATILRNE